MKEVLVQVYAAEDERGAEVQPVDLAVVGEEFKERWQDARRSRFVIEDEGGFRRVHEVYRIEIGRDSIETEKNILAFTTTAIMLGYRFTINPLVIPATEHYDNRGVNLPEALFFLERIETTAGADTGNAT